VLPRPDPLAAKRGPTSKGREREGKGEGRGEKRKEREGRKRGSGGEGKGEGRGGKRKGGEGKGEGRGPWPLVANEAFFLKSPSDFADATRVELSCAAVNTPLDKS